MSKCVKPDQTKVLATYMKYAVNPSAPAIAFEPAPDHWGHYYLLSEEGEKVLNVAFTQLSDGRIVRFVDPCWMCLWQFRPEDNSGETAPGHTPEFFDTIEGMIKTDIDPLWTI
jgi:hypothetical protein